MQSKRLTSCSTLIGAAVVFASCSGTELLTDVEATESALQSAQCTFQGFDAQAQACFAGFVTCKDAAGAVIEDCRSALRQCLPPPPPGSHPGHAGGGDEGCRGGPGGPPPPLPDGGLPPPPPGGFGPPPPLGDGARPPRPRGGHRPPPLALDSVAVAACHDALATCLGAANADQAACFEAERACIHAVFEAAFESMCADAAVRCAQPDADAERCARVTARCAAGVGGPGPIGPDGGSCE